MVCPINSRKRKHIRKLVVARYGAECFYCGVPLVESAADTDDPNRRLTIDHLKPRGHGGRNLIPNLRPACRPCNQEKGDAEPAPWLARARLRRLISPTERPRDRVPEWLESLKSS